MDSMLALLQGFRPKAPRPRSHFSKLKSNILAPVVPHFSLLKSENAEPVPPGTADGIPSHLQNYSSDESLPVHDWPVIGRYGQYRVRLVDAEEIRDSSLINQAFTDFAVHADIPTLVPPREIWVSSDVPERERSLLVHTALEQLRGLMRGLSRDDAYQRALTYQAHLRGHGNTMKGDPKDKRVLTKSPYVGDMGYTHEPRLHVRVVDGEVVRNDPNGRADFVCGGNGAEDAMIPLREVWIEEDLPAVERLVTAVHEFSEFHLMMCDGLSYNDAHDGASRVEFECRLRHEAPPVDLLCHHWVDVRLDDLADEKILS